MEANKKHRKKKLDVNYKNAKYRFEQILEAIPHKAAAGEPLISHLANRPSQTNKTCITLLEK